MQEENRASDEIFHRRQHPSAVRTVLVFVLYLLCFTASTTGEKISCSVPSAELNSTTQLTCFFSEDLSESKKDFTVYHYIQQGNPDAVLDCWWLQGKLDCFMRPGFEFNMNVTDRLTVHLPRVEDNQAGTYACQVAGYRPEHLNTCELAVKPAAVAMAAQQSNQLDVEQTEKGLSPDLKTTCLATVEVLGKPATVTCSFGGKPSETFLLSHIGANGSEDYPLLCMLVNGAHTCKVLPKYTLKGGITTFAELHIDNVTQAHLGRYQCRGLSVPSDNHGHCEIMQGQRTGDNHVVTAVVTVIVIAVVITVVGFVIFKKRRSLRAWWTARKDIKKDPETQTTDKQTVVGNGNSTLVNESETSCQNGKTSSRDSGLGWEKIGFFPRDRKQHRDERDDPVEESKQSSDENNSLSDDSEQDCNEHSFLLEGSKQCPDESDYPLEDSNQDSGENISPSEDSKLVSDMNGSFLNGSVHDACNEDITPRKRTRAQRQIYYSNNN